MKRIGLGILYAVLALSALAGCGGPAKKDSDDSVPLPGTSSSKSGTPPLAPNSETSNTPPPVDPKTGKVNPGAVKPLEPNRKLYDIPPTGTQLWTPSKMPAKELASKIGAAMKNLKATYGKTISTIKTPTGTGQVTSEVKIQDNKHYSIQYMVIGVMPETGEVRADGTRRAVTGPKGAFLERKPIFVPTPEASLSPSQISKSWPKKFPRLVFLGVTDGRDPWGPVIADLAAGKNGFKTEISERTMNHQGKQFRSVRLVAKRTATAAKTLGPCEIEMVFDGVRYLPVTMRVTTKLPKEGEYRVQWQSGWNFNQKFKPEDFKL